MNYKKNHRYIFHYSLLNLVFLLIACSAATQVAAQEYKGELPGVINTALRLQAGTYKVSGKVLVTEAAGSLTVEKNVTLLFDSAALIEVAGSAAFLGEPGAFITLKSQDPKKPGAGIRVTGYRQQPFTVSHARFYSLERPLQFDAFWYRNAVKITGSVFKFCGRNNPILEFRHFDTVRARSKCQVSIIKNTFCNNSGGIFIPDIIAQNLLFEVRGNVITRNELVGGKDNGVFTAPLFFGYDRQKGGEEPVIEDNSIFDNFNFTDQADSTAAAIINLYVLGKDNMALGENYWGSASEEKILAAIKTASISSSRLPVMLLANPITTPIPTANANFYAVLLNKAPITGIERNVHSFTPFQSLGLKFARPIFPGPGFRVLYYYNNKGNQVTGVQLPVKPVFGSDNRQMDFDFGDLLYQLPPNGGLVVDGAFDAEGNDLPAFFFGNREFFEKYKLDYNNVENFLPYDSAVAADKIWQAKQEDSIAAKQDPVILVKKDTSIRKEEVKPQKGLYLSLFAGEAGYYGDLVTSGMNPTPLRPAIGLWLRHHLSRLFSLEARLNYMTVTGSDKSPEGGSRATGFSRGLSFRSTIADLSLLLHRKLLQSLKADFSMSVHAGINAIHFTPKGKYNGTWYDLRDIGSAGQTIDGKNDRYKRITFGVPFGISIEQKIGARLKLGLNLTACRTFTDYLDDTQGRDMFPDPARLAAANPSAGIIAVELTNPSRATGLRSHTPPSKKDWYGYGGLILTYRLAGKE